MGKEAGCLLVGVLTAVYLIGYSDHLPVCLFQNIDTLERVAGLPQEKLVEAHGTFHTSHCLECGAEYSLPWMKGRGCVCVCVCMCVCVCVGVGVILGVYVCVCA